MVKAFLIPTFEQEITMTQNSVCFLELGDREPGGSGRMNRCRQVTALF